MKDHLKNLDLVGYKRVKIEITATLREYAPYLLQNLNLGVDSGNEKASNCPPVRRNDDIRSLAVSGCES